jgi:hypothetical protein
MWWRGKAIITDKSLGRQVRATFETFHRSNAPGGIRDETLEESLLLVRGKTDDGKMVSYKGGRGIITKKSKVVDYLLEVLYKDAEKLAETEFLPHIEIPLLEQQNLSKMGYARLEEQIAVEI